MFGREMKSKLPELRRENVDVSLEEVRDRDWSNKLKGKEYADFKRGAVSKSISVGDLVLLRAEKTNKLSSNFRPDPFKVIQKTGNEVTVRNDAGAEYKRNTTFVKKYYQQQDESMAEKRIESEEPDKDRDVGEAENHVSSPETQIQEPQVQLPTPSQKKFRNHKQVLRRSTNATKRPSRYTDFVMSVRE